MVNHTAIIKLASCPLYMLLVSFQHIITSLHITARDVVTFIRSSYFASWSSSPLLTF